MRTETDYRLLLERAQEAIEQIETLLAAMGTAPRLDNSIQTKLAKIANNLRTLQGDLDQLWDEFKRI